jgi:hypothetical protein
MTKLQTLVSIPILAFALGGAAHAQPTVTGNVAGGDRQSADTTRPDSGAPDAAGQAKVWHDQDTRADRKPTRAERKAARQAERDRRSAMAASPSYNPGSTPSTDTSAAPGAPGNSGAPNSRSSSGGTGGGKP